MNALAPPSTTEPSAALPQNLRLRVLRSLETDPAEVQAVPTSACAAAEARWLQRAGAIVSGACVVHCAATPVLCSAIPSLTGWLSLPPLHWCLAALAVVAWAASACRPQGRSRPWVLWLGASGLAILCGGAFGPLLWDSRIWAQLPLGVGCSCLGGGLLLASHLLGRPAAGSCRCAKHGGAIA